MYVPAHPGGGAWLWGTDHAMTTTARENAALVRRFLTDVLARGDTDAAEAFVAEDIDHHDLVFEDGHDDVTALGGRVLAAADVDVTVEEVVATDDWVAVHATVTGTHRESLIDPAPTGESFAIAYAWFCRIEEGRIAEIWSLPDGLGLVRQLGGLSGPPPHSTSTDRNTL